MEVDGITGPRTVASMTSLYRSHQRASVSMVRERQALQRPGRRHLAGARIMIDPARSVADPGPVGIAGANEHQLTWQIAAQVDGRLTALGTHVVLSRGPRSSPTPSQRARHANAELVDVIVSIHLNASASAAARGVAGYHFGTDTFVSERGRALANLAVDEIAAATSSAHCRVHPSTSALLRESRAPAAIIEAGFLSHPEEGRLLASRAGQRLIADALVTGIVTYITGGATPEGDGNAAGGSTDVTVSEALAGLE